MLKFLLSSFVALNLLSPVWAATLLPNGQQTFLDANGDPLTGGSVYFYIPSTTTDKTTWSDPDEVMPNANPVVLDAAGRATIYGSGSYRQILKDSLGNTIWDKLTSATIGESAVLWGGTSTGSANVQNIDASSFADIDGQVVAFVAGYTNTGATTVDAGSGAVAVLKDTDAGPVALTGGEIVVSNVVLALYTTSDSSFHLVNPASATVWGGTSTGSANAQSITTGFSAADGQTVAFLAGFTNTSAMTLDAGTGAVAVLRDTAYDAIALTGGEVVAGNVVLAVYATIDSSFHLVGGVSGPNYQTFTSDGTWIKPSTTAFSVTYVMCWAAGGGGGAHATGGGGGGGAFVDAWLPTSTLAATEAVTVPAGGAINTVGGNATFGSWLTAYGGGAGVNGAGGGGSGGGGAMGKGITGTTTTGGHGNNGTANGGGAGGASGSSGGYSVVGGGGGGGSGSVGVGGYSYFGGGGGSGGNNSQASGGETIYGGGGGGGGAAHTGGTSKFGGAGGAATVAGSARGGGGGRNAAGGRAECRVSTFG